MRNSIIAILLLSIISFSCSKDKEIEPSDMGYAYAGLTLGKYVVYDVDSLFYDDFNSTIDTSEYKIKELVAESYTDLEGEEAFKINRYKRNNDTLPWVLIDVWNAKLVERNYQKVEENVRYVKLVFPPKANLNWDGNIMNNEPTLYYQYTSIDAPETIGNTAFERVVTVVQDEDESNLINPVLFEEKFAYGVGMVYKRSMSLERNNLSSPWRGYDVTMTYYSSGN